MKLNKSLVTILTIAAAVTFSGFATAQEKKDEKPNPAPPPAPPAAARPAAGPRDPSAAYVRFLNLSEEQAAKVKPLLEQEYAEMKAMREDKNLSAQARVAKSREIRDATTAKVKPLLTAEQAQKWERIRTPRMPSTVQPGQPGQPGVPGQAPPPAGAPPAPAAPKADPAK